MVRHNRKSEKPNEKNHFTKFEVYENQKDNNSIASWKNTSVPEEGSSIEINGEEREIKKVTKREGGVVEIIVD